MRELTEAQTELFSRITALKGAGQSHVEIAETLTDEGFVRKGGKLIEHAHVNGYLYAIRKRSNGSIGISKAEALASRDATIEAQITLLKAQQAEGVSDLPKIVFEGGKQTVVFQMTGDGGLDVSCDGSFDFDYNHAAKLAAFIKENF